MGCSGCGRMISVNAQDPSLPEAHEFDPAGHDGKVWFCDVCCPRCYGGPGLGPNRPDDKVVA